MRDADDEYHEAIVFDGVEDAVVTHADAPNLVAPGQELRAMWPRCPGEIVDRPRDPMLHRSRQLRQLMPGACDEFDRVRTAFHVMRAAL